MTNYFFERCWPEIWRGLHKWCCERILRRLRSFWARIFFLKVASFLTFFAYPGSQISWKMTNYFFERYRPEIFRGLHKWCCERIWRRLRSFRAKKNFFEGCQFFGFFCISGVTGCFEGCQFFYFFCISGVTDQLLFWEMPAWNLSWTAQMVLRTNFKAFRLFQAKKFFFEDCQFFHFFCITGVKDFLRND